VAVLVGRYSLNDIPQARAGFGHNFFQKVPIFGLERQGSLVAENVDAAVLHNGWSCR
jgi:hypothetical protein